MDTATRDLEQQRDRQADRRTAAQCRICAADIVADDDGMHIFAEDGRRHYLQTKIRKYLHILVSETRPRFRAPPPPPPLYATGVAITCRSRSNFEIHVGAARPISDGISRDRPRSRGDRRIASRSRSSFARNRRFRQLTAADRRLISPLLFVIE